MPAFGDHEDLPHTLLPLPLAVGLVRSKVYASGSFTGRGSESDGDAIAVFIAGMASLYEFSQDPSVRPRVLARAELDGGLFRGGGRELHFIDGRAVKRSLAVHVLDMECVIAVLKDPQHAAAIRSRYTRVRAGKLRQRSERLRAAAAQLQSAAEERRPLTEASAAAASSRTPGTPAPGARSRRRSA